MMQGREEDIRRELLGRRRLAVLVRGAREVLEKALGSLAGAEVEITPRPADGGGGVTGARISSDDDLREQVGRACVEAGLGLLELREERHGLEELMMQLLEGGKAPAA